MDGKRTPELSDEALDLVAGGLSMGSSLPGISTISTSGPSVAGPGAGTGAGPVTRGGDSISKHTDMLHENNLIYARLMAAGTFEQYQRDLDEYKRQHAEWEQKCAPGGYLIPEAATSGEPVPVPPNPYDYL